MTLQRPNIFLLVTAILTIVLELYIWTPTVGYGWAGILLALVLPAIILCMAFQSNPIYGLWPLAYVCVATFFMAPAFHSELYQGLLGTPTEKGNGLPSLDLEKAGLVDEDMARRAAERLLSLEGNSALGSQVGIGQLQKQLVNGELVWVAFLEHHDFMRWLSNETTPGYVIVSAHDPSQAKLVTGLKMKYLEDSSFGDNIERHAWKQYPTAGLYDFSPELDDNGHPYWVITILELVRPFAEAQVAGVLIIDPQTGEVSKYDMAHIPAWVDRVVPESIARKQVNYWASLLHGWLNTKLSQKDVHRVTGGGELVYGKDGKSYWFLGLRTSSNDGGINGYVMVDSRSKEASHYLMSGSTEKVAVKAIEGVLPEKKYHATAPLPYLVNGEPTYVSVLTDDTGIIRAFGMMSIRSYQAVAVGETLQETARLYQSKLITETTGTPQEVKNSVVKGVIARITSDVRNGNSVWLLTIGTDKRIFAGTSKINDALPMSREGDTVEIKFQETTMGTVNMIGFQNARWPAAGAVVVAE